MAQKFKAWADQLRETPDDNVWQNIEARLQKHPRPTLLKVMTLPLWKYAAIAVFFAVFFTLLRNNWSEQRLYVRDSRAFKIEQLDLKDVSIYCSPDNISALRAAYQRLSAQ